MGVAVGVAVAAVVWHNGRHLVPEPWHDRAATVLTTMGAVAASWWLFSRVDPVQGMGAAWRWTLVAVGAAGLIAVLARVSRRVGDVVADRRMVDMRPAEFAMHVVWRIPVLTAFAEEVVHRGAVWWLLERAGGSTLALWGSSLTFALGHVIVARGQAVRESRSPLLWVLLTVLVTGVAGLVLGWLRLRTGGIWASVGVHAGVNMALALGGRHAQRRDVAEVPLH